MAKTNFTKVEESLRKGLDKLTVKKIVDSTDQKLQEKKEAENERLKRKKTAINLISELKRLHKNDERLFINLGTNFAQIKKMLEHPSKLSDEEWKTVLKLREKIDAYKKVYKKTVKEEDPIDKIVEKERSKQADRRFNIQEKWLPVD